MKTIKHSIAILIAFTLLFSCKNPKYKEGESLKSKNAATSAKVFSAVEVVGPKKMDVGNLDYQKDTVFVYTLKCTSSTPLCHPFFYFI